MSAWMWVDIVAVVLILVIAGIVWPRVNGSANFDPQNRQRLP